MKVGRKRLADPSIPDHIRQTDIPAGAYWDRRDRYWYTIVKDGGKPRRVKLANAKARLADLHTKLDAVRGVDRNSLDWLMQQYEGSLDFRDLAESTRKKYSQYRKIASGQKTRAGKLGTLPAASLLTAVFQGLVERIAKDEGTPTKANHFKRYVSVVYSWGLQHGHVPNNPVKGVKQAKERKRRRLPTDQVWESLIGFARARAGFSSHRPGSLASYLWIVMELMYLCRLRSIEVITLTEAAALPEGLLTNRRKGSRDNIVAWTPRLRTAWDAAIDRRRQILKRRGMPQQIRPEDRIVLVSQEGTPMSDSTFSSRWQALMHLAMEENVITADQRFGAHDNKRKGITDTSGTRHEKQHASGHKSERMMDIYDMEVPVVASSEKRPKPA